MSNLGLTDLNEIKRATSSKQCTQSKLESEVSDIRDANQKLRDSLFKLLIERDEVSVKRKMTVSEIEQVRAKLEAIDKESHIVFNEEFVADISDKYSTSRHLSTLRQIHLSRQKLAKYKK